MGRGTTDGPMLLMIDRLLQKIKTFFVMGSLQQLEKFNVRSMELAKSV